MMKAIMQRLPQKRLIGLLAVAFLSLPLQVQAAGGIAIQGTRIVYPQEEKQTIIRLVNSSKTDTFLVQSWVESKDGNKSKDFIVTPPLYASGPDNENSLRVMYVGAELPKDRESIYYFVAKAIPSVEDKGDEGRSVLLVAAANRIKMFVRPDGLKMKSHEAPAQLTFSRSGAQLRITNPTPYYLTLTDIQVGTQKVDVAMAPPKGELLVPLPAGSGSTVSYRTINDFGGITDAISKPLG